jgi:hypothetical protein
MAAFIDGEVVLPFFGGDTVIILATIPALPAVLTGDAVRHQSALGSAPSRRPPCVITSRAMLHASGANPRGRCDATNLRHVIHSSVSVSKLVSTDPNAFASSLRRPSYYLLKDFEEDVTGIQDQPENII